MFPARPQLVLGNQILAEDRHLPLYQVGEGDMSLGGSCAVKPQGGWAAAATSSARTAAASGPGHGPAAAPRRQGPSAPPAALRPAPGRGPHYPQTRLAARAFLPAPGTICSAAFSTHQFVGAGGEVQGGLHCRGGHAELHPRRAVDAGRARRDLLLWLRRLRPPRGAAEEGGGEGRRQREWLLGSANTRCARCKPAGHGSPPARDQGDASAAWQLGRSR